MRATTLVLRTTGSIVAMLASAARPAVGQTGGSGGSVPQATTVVDSIKVLERQVEAAYQRADAAFLQSTLRDDFQFTHATGTVAGKAETLANFAKPGNFLSRNLTSVEVELHGDVALTIGRIEVRSAVPREYTVCYVRLYARTSGGWRLVSHRTFRERDGFAEMCAPK